jgi:soluble lytic murein transglycosylase
MFIKEVSLSKRYLKIIQNNSEKYNVNAYTILAMIKTESNFNKNAVSNKGAVGLMQLMPSTANFIAKKVGFSENINLYDGQTNLYLGICYLEYLFNRYGDETIVLYCYNAGEGVVSKWTESEIKSPPYKETREYIKKVKRRKKLYKAVIC